MVGEHLSVWRSSTIISAKAGLSILGNYVLNCCNKTTAGSERVTSVVRRIGAEILFAGNSRWCILKRKVRKIVLTNAK